MKTLKLAEVTELMNSIQGYESWMESLDNIKSSLTKEDPLHGSIEDAQAKITAFFDTFSLIVTDETSSAALDADDAAQALRPELERALARQEVH
ncbi:TPA: hypothetical protein ACGUPM_002683 [Vibrio vulnificus]